MNSKVFVFLILSTTSYRISLAQSYNVTDNEPTQPPSSNTETPRTTYQSEDYPKWVSSSRGGKIPLGAIQGGIDSDAGVAYDGAYYVCRVRLLGNLTNGKMHNRHSRCYIPYGGIEHTYNEYEILCCGR